MHQENWEKKESEVPQLCLTLCEPMDYTVHGVLLVRITGVGRHSLLQFPTQGANPVDLCRQILYQLSHKGSPRILEWVAYSFSSGSSQPRDWTRVSCIAGGFFTNWAIREAPFKNIGVDNWGTLKSKALWIQSSTGAWKFCNLIYLLVSSH